MPLFTIPIVIPMLVRNAKDTDIPMFFHNDRSPESTENYNDRSSVDRHCTGYDVESTGAMRASIKSMRDTCA